MLPLPPVVRRRRAANLCPTTLETNLLAPRALHTKLRDADVGESLGDEAGAAGVSEEREAVARVGRTRRPGGLRALTSSSRTRQTRARHQLSFLSQLSQDRGGVPGGLGARKDLLAESRRGTRRPAFVLCEALIVSTRS